MKELLIKTKLSKPEHTGDCRDAGTGYRKYRYRKYLTANQSEASMICMKYAHGGWITAAFKLTDVNLFFFSITCTLFSDCI